VRISPRRIGALAYLAIQESIRRKVLVGFLIFLLILLFALAHGMVDPIIAEPSVITLVRASGQSSLYQVQLPAGTQWPYAENPWLIDLRGSRRTIGYDYAALLHAETLDTFSTFLNSVIPSMEDQILIATFLDYCWDSFLAPNTHQRFLEELEGMYSYHVQHGTTNGLTTDAVARRFYTLANLPADTDNIISMLEQELEGNWPEWLREVVNEIIKLLEKFEHGCDAYGVWGSRTEGGLLYSSRNLDWNSNTGIDKNKLIAFYTITDPSKGTPIPTYTTLGFTVGLGALAGMSSQGISVSEMNLDNSEVTFSGSPFPLRLRYILEEGNDLKTSMAAWSATNNTNSFNFLIGSANDILLKKSPNGAYALETIKGYTSAYGANSPIEKSATYYCAPGKCNWTNQTGTIYIGKPMPEVVFRTNHAFDPRIMKTQEPLFNDTVFRYDLLHDLFYELEQDKQLVNDKVAVAITATLGTKGKNFMSCDPANFPHGENVMSIAYAPGARGTTSKHGHLYIAWEQGGAKWRPAACNPYVMVNLDRWVAQE